MSARDVLSFMAFNVFFVYVGLATFMKAFLRKPIEYSIFSSLGDWTHFGDDGFIDVASDHSPDPGKGDHAELLQLQDGVLVRVLLLHEHCAHEFVDCADEQSLQQDQRTERHEVEVREVQAVKGIFFLGDGAAPADHYRRLDDQDQRPEHQGRLEAHRRRRGWQEQGGVRSEPTEAPCTERGGGRW